MYMYLIVYLYASHTWFCDYIIPICSCMICCFPSGCCRECVTGHTLVTRRDVVVIFCCILRMCTCNLQTLSHLWVFMVFRTHITIHWSCFQVVYTCFRLLSRRTNSRNFNLCDWELSYQFVDDERQFQLNFKIVLMMLIVTILLGIQLPFFLFCLLHWYVLMLGPYASINVSLQSQSQK